MSRVEPTNRSEQKRETQQRHPQTANVGHTPSKAEGDERTIEEALKNQERSDKRE
jgi:hypothetical protein